MSSVSMIFFYVLCVSAIMEHAIKLGELLPRLLSIKAPLESWRKIDIDESTMGAPKHLFENEISATEVLLKKSK